MMSNLMGRRRAKAPARDRGGGGGGDRGTQRSTGRAMENLDMMEGMLGGEKGGVGGEKHLAHREWTKEPFPDDFDDEDLE
ncbi:unnamed protein product [Pylaiella littoralis]